MTDIHDTPLKLACTPKRLPLDQFIDAATHARRINPHNHPGLSPHVLSEDGGIPSKAQIAVLTSKYWGVSGVDLTVSFLDQRGEKNRGFRETVLRHMNAWAANPRAGAAQANIRFRETGGSADVRITTQPGGGHWSYIGTDIHMIHDLNKPTMNLDGFSSLTSESEFCRVVRHETGHTLGCPHEHMRGELIKLIDVDRAKAFYLRTQNWTAEQTVAQVLTPLEEGSLIGTDRADPMSIMCYQIPAELTTHGQPILGGADIDTSDYDFITRIYPRPALATAGVAATPVMAAAAAAAAPAAAAPAERAAAPRDRRSAIAATHIVVGMPGDIDVSIPPDATQAQIRHVLKALD